MIELALTLLVSILGGALIGLLPGMPIWLGVFIIFPFVDSISAAQIMMYWMGLAIGSQFFGSVSTLLLRIPGENSSLVYLRDTFNLSIQQRLDLVRQTAWGSAVATFIAIAVVSILYYISADETVIQWTSSSVKFVVYSLLIFLLIATADRKIWAVLLFIIGLILAEKTNLALPELILSINYNISHVTIFSATLALIIIPEIIDFKRLSVKSEKRNLDYTDESINWKKIFSGSAVGCFSGLIPGMTATIGSIAAYKFTRGSIQDKIISAESANNSAIITMLLPFLIIGIPTTIDGIIVSNNLSLKLLEMPSVFREEMVFGISLAWITIFSCLFFSLIFFYLSQRFLSYYVKMIELIHTKLLFIYLIVISILIYVDATTNPINIVAYFSLMIVMSLCGIWLKKNNINPLPFLLALLLGDNILWTVYHISTIYL